MQLAMSKSILLILSATRRGTAKALPTKLKFVFKGDQFAWISPDPSVNCHHGTNTETTINTSVHTPPAMPNQFILFCKFLHLLRKKRNIHIVTVRNLNAHPANISNYVYQIGVDR